LVLDFFDAGLGGDEMEMEILIWFDGRRSGLFSESRMSVCAGGEDDEFVGGNFD
jgi:hypothetical protein